MAGGFVIGLMSERVAIVEPAIATVLTLAIDAIIATVGGLSGMFLFSFAIAQGNYGTALTIAAVAFVAAMAGSLTGERMTVPTENWVDQTLVILGMSGLVAGPFLLLGTFLPRPVSIGMGVLLLCAIWLISHHFHQQDREEEELSIRPESVRR
jgi:hypothetical protein